MRKAALFCLPLAGAVAAWRYLLPAAWLLPTLGLCLLGVSAAFLLRGSARLRAALLLAGAAAGFLACGAQRYLVIRPSEAMVDERLSVSARVTDYPDLYEGSGYVTVRLTGQGVPHVRCRLVSYVEGELDELVPGDEITCEMRFMSALVRNGQEVDTWFAQGIFLRAVCTDTPELTGRWPFSFIYLPGALCRRIAALCRAIFDADASPFMTALLTGDKAELYKTAEDYNALCEAGLSHVVAVSGMHLSILAGFFFLLLGRRRGAVIASFPLLFLFAAMTGFTPSVTRAVFMQLCLLSAPLFHREEDALTSLSIVLAAMLLKNPSAVAGTSLQLSFASMAGIWLVSDRMYSALYAVIEERIPGSKLLRRVLIVGAANLSMSLGSMVFTLPLAAAHFGYVSTVGPLSNVLCLWMITALYIGGFAAVALGAAFPVAGAALGGVLSWGVRYVFLVARLLAKLPCAAVYMSNPLYVLWLGFSYVIFIAAWLSGRRSRNFRPAAPICLSLILLYGSALTVRASWDDDLRVTALDVGQGESVVLTCGPRAVIVDCGGSAITHDAGEAATHFLRGQQRMQVDALVLTHLHADHVNGAADLLAKMDVGTLYLPRQEDTQGYLPAILAAAEKAGTRVAYVTEDTVVTLGELELTLWAPILPGDENENCMIVMARQADFEVFITGDSLSAAERLLLTRYELPDAEVLVVGHHGSNTSTCEAFLKAIRPDVALISVGYNTYGHPSAAVLERLEAYHIPVLRTDLDGAVTVKAGG